MDLEERRHGASRGGTIGSRGPMVLSLEVNAPPLEVNAPPLKVSVPPLEVPWRRPSRSYGTTPQIPFGTSRGLMAPPLEVQGGKL